MAQRRAVNLWHWDSDSRIRRNDSAAFAFPRERYANDSVGCACAPKHWAGEAIEGGVDLEDGTLPSEARSIELALELAVVANGDRSGQVTPGSLVRGTVHIEVDAQYVGGFHFQHLVGLDLRIDATGARVHDGRSTEARTEASPTSPSSAGDGDGDSVPVRSVCGMAEPGPGPAPGPGPCMIELKWARELSASYEDQRATINTTAAERHPEDPVARAIAIAATNAALDSTCRTRLVSHCIDSYDDAGGAWLDRTEVRGPLPPSIAWKHYRPEQEETLVRPQLSDAVWFGRIGWSYRKVDATCTETVERGTSADWDLVRV